MTDYNDGKWHGWNGGECPVRPDTEVEGIYMQGDQISPSSPLTDEASIFDWNYKNRYRLVAFRVVKEYREPREFWVCEGTGYRPIYDTLSAAETYRDHNKDVTIIRVREVSK
jgi:hypothetical protein